MQKIKHVNCVCNYSEQAYSFPKIINLLTPWSSGFVLGLGHLVKTFFSRFLLLDDIEQANCVYAFMKNKHTFSKITNFLPPPPQLRGSCARVWL